MDWVTDPEIWASLLTLTALEIVLGIDNLVFIAILAGRLPAEKQNRARQIGLALALLTRLALLASIKETLTLGLTRYSLRPVVKRWVASSTVNRATSTSPSRG